MSRLAIVGALLTLQLWTGCTSSRTRVDDGNVDESDVGDGLDDATWYTDVKPLMESHCISCHREGAVGTFSLDTLESVSIVSEQVADAVQDRRMPPWRAAEGCDEYRDDISLSDDQIDMIVDWIDAGMPEGDISLAREGELPESTSLDRVDVRMGLPEAYTPDATKQDDYRCFAMPWPLEEDVFVTGFGVDPGQANLVHHVVSFIGDADLGETLQQMEADDGQAGFPCHETGLADTGLYTSWLGAWSPGAGSSVFPNGVGISLKVGDWLILQIHYSLINTTTAADQTTISFQVESEVERAGWFQPFVNPDWHSDSGMLIPAETDGVQHHFSREMSDTYDIHRANLHMHRLGSRTQMSLTKPDGTEDCLLKVDDWDFDWQRSYTFDEMKTISPGDVWSLECEWDNPTDQDVQWGPGSDDEMCIGTLLMSTR